ncbi:MAG: VOC family protein [Acidimicrobiia bacterium]|nr:VOC family protein [Acidimicrobiia bacterium]
MELRGVHHVSINVSDLDDTLAFYTDTVGLAVLPRPDGIGPGVWLGCPDGREIHLLLRGDVPDNLGQHYAFEVGSVEETKEALAAGGRKVSKTSEIAGVCRQVFCRDPSGNLLEFNQPLR